MKVQRNGGRVVDLPDRLAERLIARGRFNPAGEVPEEVTEPVVEEVKKVTPKPKNKKAKTTRKPAAKRVKK